MVFITLIVTLNVHLFPLQALDYSDDEQEQEAKRRAKNSRKKTNNDAAGNHTGTHNISSIPQQNTDLNKFKVKEKKCSLLVLTLFFV